MIRAKDYLNRVTAELVLVLVKMIPSLSRGGQYWGGGADHWILRRRWFLDFRVLLPKVFKMKIDFHIKNIYK